MWNNRKPLPASTTGIVRGIQGEGKPPCCGRYSGTDPAKTPPRFRIRRGVNVANIDRPAIGLQREGELGGESYLGLGRESASW